MFRNIMVPLDGSPFGEHALPLALAVARRGMATIELVHVCPPIGPHALPNDGLPAHERALAYLDQLAGSLSARWSVAISTTVLSGIPADILHKHALANSADLVVMTTHGRGAIARSWLGAVADKLVRRLPMPVLLARPHGEMLDLLEDVREFAFEHVLIPLDGSPLAEEALEPALALGDLMGADFTLVQAIEPVLLTYAPAAQAAGVDERFLQEWRAETLAYLEQVARRLRTNDRSVHTRVLYGQPAVAIIDYAREHGVDLIALCTHGRSGIARMLLGSVADKVVRGSGAAVLVKRPGAEREQGTRTSHVEEWVAP
jgi:nucleotide-binding universal stress UspA family protein